MLWSRSGNSPVTYSSHSVYLSGHSTQIEPYQSNGVAIDCIPWSRSAYNVYNGSLWVIISDGSPHADDYHYSALYSNGVASVCFRCGRGVVTVVTVIVFGVLPLVEFPMMYIVVQVMSSELPLMFIIFLIFNRATPYSLNDFMSW